MEKNRWAERQREREMEVYGSFALKGKGGENAEKAVYVLCKNEWINGI